MIADGVIGQLCWAACGASFETFHLDEDGRQRLRPIGFGRPFLVLPNPGGGPVYDMTVYALHALTAILGSAVAVTALSGRAITERELRGRRIEPEAHDNTVMLLDFGESLYAFVLRHARPASSPAVRTGIRTVTTTAPRDRSPGFCSTESRSTIPAAHSPKGSHGGKRVGAAPHHRSPSRPDRTARVRGRHAARGLVRDGTPTPVTAEAARHVIEIIEPHTAQPKPASPRRSPPPWKDLPSEYHQHSDRLLRRLRVHGPDGAYPQHRPARSGGAGGAGRASRLAPAPAQVASRYAVARTYPSHRELARPRGRRGVVSGHYSGQGEIAAELLAAGKHAAGGKAYGHQRRAGRAAAACRVRKRRCAADGRLHESATTPATG